MTKNDIVAKVKELNLPAGGYTVFGSCPLTVAGLREANDIDMLVSDGVMVHLERAGWKQVDKGENDNPLTHGVFEVASSWNFSSYRPTLEQLLKTADVIDGVPFASLTEVRKWKVASGHPKDLQDIELIDNYVSKSATA